MIPNRNSDIQFDQAIRNALGEYVYALRDPRDRKVFYIGKGQNDRVLSHFDEAYGAQISNVWTSKCRRILEIWAAGEAVDWFIVRFGLQEVASVNAFDVEASIIDVLEISQNGPSLNEVKGHHVDTRGILSSDEVAALAAKPVNPKIPYELVIVFPIQNALEQTNENVYAATRAAWRLSKRWRELPAFAVGVANGISKGAFSIDSWSQLPNGKWGFDGESCEVEIAADLIGKKWLTVINQTKGYWQRGNPIVVSFDGKGRFRIIRGTESDWLRC